MTFHKRNRTKDRWACSLSYPTTFTHMSNVLPSDQLLIRKLQVPIADLNTDFMLIKSCTETLVKDKIALVLQACKILSKLYSLFLLPLRAGDTPYRRCFAGCRIWPLLNKLTPELITYPLLLWWSCAPHIYLSGQNCERCKIRNPGIWSFCFCIV